MPSESGEKLAQIALVWAGRLGPAGFRRLIGHLGSAMAVLDAPIQELARPGLGLAPDQAQAIGAVNESLPRIEEQIDALHEQNVGVVCDFEPEYPQILRRISNPPPVLCIAGRLLSIDDPAIAIVGTRRPTEEGYQMAYELGRAFGGEGVTVVSGLAQGCDTGAHTGALAGGGRTIAVLGSGITVIHPRHNAEIASRIAKRGAVISEAPPSAHPTVARLIARNRLQSGLARGVVVVESRERGGAMQTAKNARRQGREVYAVGWPQAHKQCAGNNRLLSGGAQPIAGPDQVPVVSKTLYLHKERMEREQAIEATQQRLFEES